MTRKPWALPVKLTRPLASMRNLPRKLSVSPFSPRASNGSTAGFVREFRYRPTLADFRAGFARMFQKEVVELGPFDVESHRLACEAALLEDQLERFARVAEVKLRAKFFRKPGRLKFGQHAHFLEQAMIVRQERFADVKAGETFLLQHEHAFARAGEIGGRTAAARPATDDQRIVNRF